MVWMPKIIERTGTGVEPWDPVSRLLKDRIILLDDVITQPVASLIVAQLLYLQLENKEQDIHLYIMSPGGSIPAGMAIYDTMQHVTNNVATYCIGMAASMGAFLLAAGTKGKRHALPNARIMLHQPTLVVEGTAADIEIHAEEALFHRRRMNELLAKHTGQPLERIDQDTDRDFFMSPEEALKYGIIDEVLRR